MTPRPYQEDALKAISGGFDSGLRRVLVQMPTGTGKTVVFLSLIQRLREAGIVSAKSPAVILAHREELLQQPVDRMLEIDDMLRVGVERADKSAPPGCEVIVASVQSVGRKNARLADITPGVVIVDEAHHCAANSYHIALRKWRVFERNGSLLVGVTATPKRLDRQALYDHKDAIFQQVVYKYSIEQAIDDGWLAPVRGYRVRTNSSLDGVSVRGGDFSDGDLAKLLGNQERTQIAIDRWREVADGRKTIVFCVDVAHAEQAAEQWARETGAPCFTVSGKTESSIRQSRIQDFRVTPGAVLTNVDVATEGFDVPDVACVVMLRPTKSGTRYMQCVGRGLRLAPGKADCIVLDLVDATKHSLVNLPAILDLPPHLDLQGRTLKEARDKMQALGESGFKAIKEKQPETFAELDTLIEQVDMLRGVATPPSIGKYTSYRWIEAPDGYSLSAGKGRRAALTQDTLGDWVIEWTMGAGIRRKVLGADLRSAVERADRGLTKLWSDSIVLASRKGWAAEAPTNKQRDFLRFRGVEEIIIDALETRGQASSLISKIKEGLVAFAVD